MRVRKSVWLPGLFVAIILGLVACGSDATATPQPIPTATVSPTAEPVSQQDSPRAAELKPEYLAEVRRAEFSTAAIFQGFRTVFAQSYPVREALITALLQAGVGTPFIEKTAILEELDPPERFRGDHQIWLEAARELLRVDTEAAEAIDAGDLVRFSVLNGKLAGVDVAARIALSTAFCLNAGFVEEQTVLCTPVDSELEGEYQIAINDLIRGFMPEFATSRGNIGFRLSLTPEELNQVLSETGANARDAFQGFATALDTVTAPEEMKADHERLQTFFDRAIDIVSEVYRLGQENDLDGARGELLKLEPAFCDARGNFESEDFKDAVAIMFVGSATTCGGTGF